MEIKSTKLGSSQWPGTIFAATAGAFLGLALLKFGNPVVLDPLVVRPANRDEMIYQPWPSAWGYGLLAALAMLGLSQMRWKSSKVPWLLWLPTVWFGWQLIAATQTIDAKLTSGVLKHFTSCLACFYLGYFALSRVKNMAPFWFGLGAGLALVMWFGFNQHYGGLDEMRRVFYEQPNWIEFPAEYLKKIKSNRIFSTLVYPNALAGALILLLPVTLVFLWQVGQNWPRVLRSVLVGLVAYSGVACLVWSGSKMGWLVALAMGLVVLLHTPISRRGKILVATAVMVCGLAGFFIRYSAYFEKGATSVSARVDYWRAAWQTVQSRPVFGSGPGTFSVAYARVKSPDAEMARLAHNDYLEQASDSGLFGGLCYLGFVVLGLTSLYRQLSFANGAIPFAVWLGLLGWAIQGLTEFGLYIPALAWPAFMSFGWLLALPRENESTNSAASG